MFGAKSTAYPCGKFAGIQEFYLGNILDQSLSTIIKSRKYLDYLDIANYLSDKCYQCRWVRVCNNGCTYERYRGDGNFDKIAPFCKTWKAAFEYIEGKVEETRSLG